MHRLSSKCKSSVRRYVCRHATLLTMHQAIEPSTIVSNLQGAAWQRPRIAPSADRTDVGRPGGPAAHAAGRAGRAIAAFLATGISTACAVAPWSDSIPDLSRAEAALGHSVELARGQIRSLDHPDLDHSVFFGFRWKTSWLATASSDGVISIASQIPPWVQDRAESDWATTRPTLVSSPMPRPSSDTMRCSYPRRIVSFETDCKRPYPSESSPRSIRGQG